MTSDPDTLLDQWNDVQNHDRLLVWQKQMIADRQHRCCPDMPPCPDCHEREEEEDEREFGSQ